MTVLSRERFKLHPAEVAKPKYEQLKSFVLAELNSGRLKPGDVLPSEPKLADSLQVARNTIRQALGELEQEGVIQRIKGQGTFVRDIPKEVPLQGIDAFAIVVPETVGGSFYIPLVNGFEKACNAIHNEMIIRSTGNNPSRQADAILALMDKKVAGIAMVPASSVPTPPYQIRQLQQQGVPVVFCHRGVKGITAPTLSISYQQIGRMAGEQFLKYGHKRVAYLGLSPSNEEARVGYKLGLQESLAQGGASVEEVCVTSEPTDCHRLPIFKSEACVREGLQEIFSHKERPTAIFTPFDPLAEMVMLLLGDMGIRVPDDISLLSFGSKCRETLLSRRLSAVVIDSIEMGQKASDLLAEMRSGQRQIDNNEQFNIAPEFWEGTTLGPASGV